VTCDSSMVPVSSTNKTDRHDKTEILLKVVFDSITLDLCHVTHLPDMWWLDITYCQWNIRRKGFFAIFNYQRNQLVTKNRNQRKLFVIEEVNSLGILFFILLNRSVKNICNKILDICLQLYKRYIFFSHHHFRTKLYFLRWNQHYRQRTQLSRKWKRQKRYNSL